MANSLIPLNIKSQAPLNLKDLMALYTSLMSIGERIRQLREAHRMSGEAFGEICGVSKGSVSQWENDDVIPPVSRLLLLKDQIDFSIDYIYTGKISIAEEIALRLGAKERQAWYRAGNSLAEPSEGTNGKQ